MYDSMLLMHVDIVYASVRQVLSTDDVYMHTDVHVDTYICTCMHTNIPVVCLRR